MHTYACIHIETKTHTHKHVRSLLNKSNKCSEILLYAMDELSDCNIQLFILPATLR